MMVRYLKLILMLRNNGDRLTICMKVNFFIKEFLLNLIFCLFQVFGTIDTTEKPVELENVNSETLKKVNIV